MLDDFGKWYVCWRFANCKEIMRWFAIAWYGFSSVSFRYHGGKQAQGNWRLYRDTANLRKVASQSVANVQHTKRFQRCLLATKTKGARYAPPIKVLCIHCGNSPTRFLYLLISIQLSNIIIHICASHKHYKGNSYIIWQDALIGTKTQKLQNTSLYWYPQVSTDSIYPAHTVAGVHTLSCGLPP